MFISSSGLFLLQKMSLILDVKYTCDKNKFSFVSFVRCYLLSVFLICFK